MRESRMMGDIDGKRYVFAHRTEKMGQHRWEKHGKKKHEINGRDLNEKMAEVMRQATPIDPETKQVGRYVGGLGHGEGIFENESGKNFDATIQGFAATEIQMLADDEDALEQEN